MSPLDSVRASGSTASTMRAEDNTYLWEDKHVHWARAMGQALLGVPNRDALVDLLVYREVALSDLPPGSSMYETSNEGRTIHAPFAPAWLHAFWDLASEEAWDEDEAGYSRKRPLTSRDQDMALGRRLLASEEFRLAFGLAYDTGGIPAAMKLALLAFNEWVATLPRAHG